MDGTLEIIWQADSRLVENMYKYYTEGDMVVYVRNLVVRPEQRGKGIGFALLEEAEKAALDVGACAMLAHVEAANSNAVRLYEKFGFSCISGGTVEESKEAFGGVGVGVVVLLAKPLERI